MNRAIAAIIGAVLGVVLVRYVFLDTFEEVAWGLFWDGLFAGKSINPIAVIKSATFRKVAAGLGAGAIIPLIVLRRRKPKELEDET